MVFLSVLGFQINRCALCLTFNMVSERDIEHTLETQENTTNDGNRIEETIDSFSAVVAVVVAVDARISAAMDEWFRRI